MISRHRCCQLSVFFKEAQMLLSIIQAWIAYLQLNNLLFVKPNGKEKSKLLWSKEKLGGFGTMPRLGPLAQIARLNFIQAIG
jgi:hypothetical protein